VSGKGRDMSVAWHNFKDWRESAQSFAGLAAHTPAYEETVLGTGQPIRTPTSAVSAGFFRTLGVDAARGRVLLDDDHRKGVEPMAVVSDRFWRTYLGASPDFTDRHINLSGFEMRIVGVMPPTFDYPANIDIWYPAELEDQNDDRTSHNYSVVGRLKSGVTIAQGDAELDAITRRFLVQDPGAAREQGFEDFFPRSANTVPLRTAIVGNMQRPLWILLGASMLVLLVACTNLASTTLARGTARTREYAIRHALGAGRAQMTRILVTETLLLSAIGAFVGLVLAALVIKILPLLAPAGVPRAANVRLNPPVLAFTILLSLLTATAAGLLPGLRVSKTAVQSLRSGGRLGDDGTRLSVWKWLIGSEVALALVLLIGSGLLLRSFWTVLTVQPGFNTSGLLTATVNPPTSKYGEKEQKRLYYAALLRELKSVPGVQSLGFILAAPMQGVSNGLIDVDNSTQKTIDADYQVVAGDYFKTVGISMLRGRDFDARDNPTADHTVIVNRALAEAVWPGKDPIGQRITGGGMDEYWNQKKWATVIGVVADTRQRDLTSPVRPTIYFSIEQRAVRTWTMTAVFKPTRGEANALSPLVRAAVTRVDADVPVKFATMEERLGSALAARRFVLGVILVFAVIALLLATVGVYGVVAYAVERRRREIGIRMALGALPSTVRAQLQREYMIAIAFGATAGTALALGFTRVLATLLYEVKPTDPFTFAAVLGLLGAAGWLASFIPALRSTRVDPLETMRQ
jgi:predicted permease